MFLSKKKSIRLALAFSIIVAAMLVAKNAGAAPAAVSKSHSEALIVFVEGALTKDGNVTYSFVVGSTLHNDSPFGGTLAISPCHNGQTEIKMAHRTRHLTSGESLMLDKAGNLVWHMPTIPASGGLNRLRIAFQLPQGKGGPFYCLRVTAQAYGGVLPGPVSYEAPVALN